MSQEDTSVRQAVEQCACGAAAASNGAATIATFDSRLYRLAACEDCPRRHIDHRIDIAPEGFLQALEAYQKDYYERVVEARGDEFLQSAATRLDAAWNAPVRRMLVEVLGARAAPTILDLGCGAGTAARFLAQSNVPVARYIGMDISDGYLNVARHFLYPFPASFSRRSSFDFEANGYELGIDRADAFLSLMVFSHMPRRHVAGILGKLRDIGRKDVIVQDYIAPDVERDDLFMMLNETFPLFVHNMPGMLASAGFRIVRTERTLPLYGGSNWKVLHAVRT